MHVQTVDESTAILVQSYLATADITLHMAALYVQAQQHSRSDSIQGLQTCCCYTTSRNYYFLPPCWTAVYMLWTALGVLELSKQVSRIVFCYFIINIK
jgi:hypothetical protein